MNPVYETLFAAISPLITHYRADLEVYDRDCLAANPGVPFLHWTRASGTHLVLLAPHDSPIYPPPGTKIKHLFGHATREELAKTFLDVADYFARNREVLATHWFDGRTLRPVTTERAATIAQEHRANVLRAWNRAA